jgi:hypothetical protein
MVSKNVTVSVVINLEREVNERGEVRLVACEYWNYIENIIYELSNNDGVGLRYLMKTPLRWKMEYIRITN